MGVGKFSGYRCQLACGIITDIAAKAAVTDETGLLFKLIVETVKHSKY